MTTFCEYFQVLNWDDAYARITTQVLWSDEVAEAPLTSSRQFINTFFLADGSLEDAVLSRLPYDRVSISGNGTDPITFVANDVVRKRRSKGKGKRKEKGRERSREDRVGCPSSPPKALLPRRVEGVAILAGGTRVCVVNTKLRCFLGSWSTEPVCAR